MATERVNTLQFGTTRNFSNFTGTLTVASGTVISFTQSYEGEEIVVPAGFATALGTGTLKLYAKDWTTIDGQFTTNEDGTITITRAVPVLTVDAAEVEFSDTTKWSAGSVPGSGSIVIKNTLGADATIKVASQYSFSDIAIVSENARIGFEYGVGASLSTTAVSVNPSTATLKVTAAESPYQAAISGAGKVETYGDVRFTRPSSFTGGLTVKSGTASTDESAKPSGTNKTNTGFGGGDDADAGQITVEDGACVDIANTVDRCYTYTIAGKGVATTNDDGTVTYSGAMKNSGTGMDDGRRQTKAITLTTNALITADANCWWGLVNNSGSGASSLRLNGYTLTKQGAGDFFLVDTLAPTDSSGTIIVKEGEFSAHKTGCVLNNVVLKMQGTSILDLSANLSGLSKLILSPNVGGLTANNLGARLNASVPVVINAACLDAAKIPSGTESLTLLTGNMDSLTNNTAYTVALGGRFSGYEFAEDGTSLTATLQTLKPFLHYDFNGSAMTVDGAKASDSRNQISSWVNVPALVAKGRNGSSAHVANGSTTYWSSMNATQSALDSAGAITVTTVARLPFVATGTSPLWCLGSGCNGSQASSIILRAVDATTVAALAFDRADNGQNTVGRELARVTGIEDLATKFHFFALVVTGEGTRLYVDRMPTVETEACAPINTMSTAGQLGAIFGNSWKYTQNLGTAGFYLDDWQVYDAILTEKEIQALRRTYCPSPFVLIVQ